MALVLGASALAAAQDAPPPGPAVEEPTTTEEAQRAQVAAHEQAVAATAAREGTREEDGASDAPEARASTASEDDAEGDDASEPDASLSAAVFPPPPPPEPEPDPELEEDLHLAPPEPEWRLRLGIGASAATSGIAVLSLRLMQELEWMPRDAAPILFAITGGEVIGDFVIGLAGARVGLYGTFCQDRIVTCTGVVALRAGAIFGGLGTAFDIGGDGDARFRFDGVELAVRVGFWVIQGATFVDLVGMVGAAF